MSRRADYASSRTTSQHSRRGGPSITPAGAPPAHWTPVGGVPQAAGGPTPDNGVVPASGQPAPGGIADYLRRYGPLYQSIEREHGPLDWTDDALLRQVEDQRRALLPLDGLPERSVWRDRRLMALAAQKQSAAQTIGE